jgi:hypothetical protein
LAEYGTDKLPDDSTEDVGRSSGGKWNHHCDWTRRVLFLGAHISSDANKHTVRRQYANGSTAAVANSGHFPPGGKLRSAIIYDTWKNATTVGNNAGLE